MNKAFYTKPFIIYLSAALLAATTFSGPAEAMFIPISAGQGPAKVTPVSVQRTADVARIQKALESRIIQQKLMDLGLSHEGALARLNHLSTEQIHELAAHADAIQAGGDGGIITVYLAVLAIYLVLNLVVAIVGCIAVAHGGTSAQETVYKTDDLNPDFVKEFKINSGYFYKFDPGYSVDYMVSMVRMKASSSPVQEDTDAILLSFGLIGKEKYFDCNAFYAKLSAEETELVESMMKGHPFICRSPHYTVDAALASFPEAFAGQINTYRSVDAHWAWFDATGDTEPLKRLLDNYLYNPGICADCIKWSYSYNVIHNTDVKNYLLKYMNGKTDPEKQKLSTLLPK
jgi:hypothetical protein